VTWREGEDKEQEVIISRYEGDYVQPVNGRKRKLTSNRALLLIVIDKI
jgi:hypothetical protein